MKFVVAWSRSRKVASCNYRSRREPTQRDARPPSPRARARDEARADLARAFARRDTAQGRAHADDAPRGVDATAR